MNVSDCRLIDLPKFLDKRGNLSFAEEFKHIPFKIERTYWIYDVPGGEKRGRSEGMHIKKIRNLLLHFPVVLMCSWMMVKRGEKSI